MFESGVCLALLGVLLGAPQQSEGNFFVPVPTLPSILNPSKWHELLNPDPFVLYLKEGERDCVATMIDSQYILTAARCLETVGERTTVTYGCILVNALTNAMGCKNMAVKNRIRHADYAPASSSNSSKHDIAVAKLAHPITDMKPIALAENLDSLLSGQATIVGYKPALGPFDKLSKLKTSIKTDIRKQYKISEEVFVIENIKGIDESFAGGPLIFGDTLYGIESTQPNSKHHPARFMNVNFYRTFIEESIEKLKQES